MCNSFGSQEDIIRETTGQFIGYQLGGIGFVSLADLKLSLCGEKNSVYFSSRISVIQGFSSDPRACFLFPLLMVSI